MQIAESLFEKKQLIEAGQWGSENTQDIDVLVDFIRTKINACLELRKDVIAEATFKYLIQSQACSEDPDRTLEVIHFWVIGYTTLEGYLIESL